MVDGLIAATEIGLVALVGVLALRMASLARQEPLMAQATGRLTPPSQQPPWPPRGRVDTRSTVAATPHDTELRTQLLILAGLQDGDCRKHGLVLTAAPETVRAYSAAWLYGAGCALSSKPVRHSEALAGIVARIVSRKMDLRQPEALQTISTLTSSSALLACYRAGLEGAEHWRKHQFVPARHSLYHAITSNAFI